MRKKKYNEIEQQKKQPEKKSQDSPQGFQTRSGKVRDRAPEYV